MFGTKQKNINLQSKYLIERARGIKLLELTPNWNLNERIHN